jgi:hypothetical protein
MNYLVVEMQTSADGVLSHLETVHKTKAEAEQKYHQILSYAAVSNLPYHSAIIISEKGEWIAADTYPHE